MLENKIKEYISSKKLDDNILLLTDPSNIYEYYKEADIFLTTSIYEGTSNSIMEAMAFSLPIVATNVGDNSRLVNNNYNGYLTDTKDYKIIANKLYSLLLSHEKRIEYGKNSYKLIQKNYSLKTFKSNYISLIENL
jgi:glycosyltransferase involved in cell wall biosynthesis